jgi:hypothetical protein
MGEPVGKASGRTSERTSTGMSDTCRSSLSVTSSDTLTDVKSIAVRSLEERFTYVRFCNWRGIKRLER